MYKISASKLLSWDTCCNTRKIATTTLRAYSTNTAYIPQIWDTRSNKLQSLPAILGLERLVWYSCGPTVYDAAHLGHARAYVTTDILRRIITQSLGYQPFFVMGMTDIDDKIINRAQEQCCTPADLARYWEAQFMTDMAELGVEPPAILARVSEHIPQIIAYIQQLEDAGFTYTDDKGVWFRVAQLGPAYGRLHPSAVPEVQETSTGHDQRDFALWKAAKPGEPSWESPWGPGRPGWHIECSAMALAATGKDTLHIHSGGIDLRFPHHTNEAAQSEARLVALQGEHASACAGCAVAAADQVPHWVQAWLHIGHVHIAGKKMSKSLKNFISVREFLDAGGQPDVFRMWCALHHYRAPVTYSPSALAEPQAVLAQIQHAARAAASAASLAATAHMKPGATLPQSAAESALRQAHSEAVMACQRSACDDLHTPGMVRQLQGMAGHVSQYLAAAGPAVHPLLLYDVCTWMHRVGVHALGFSAPSFPVPQVGASAATPAATSSLGTANAQRAAASVHGLRAALRAAAKAKQNLSPKQLYALSDALRDQLLPELGEQDAADQAAGASTQGGPVQQAAGEWVNTLQLNQLESER